MSERPTPPPAPEFGEALAPTRPSSELLEFLARRRSTPAAQLTAPGPTPVEVDALLAIASRSPDHGKLAPWRFIVFEGEAREAAGRIVEKIAASEGGLDEARAAIERERFMRAPVVIAVVSRVTENHKIPEWEQQLSSGAVCFNLLLAAQAMGFAGAWITEWCAYHRDVRRAFGLELGERISGFIHLGSAKAEARERARPVPAELISRWRPA